MSDQPATVALRHDERDTPATRTEADARTEPSTVAWREEVGESPTGDAAPSVRVAGVSTTAAAQEYDLRKMFTRRWVCFVFRSGYHNGVICNPTEPHGGWDCGYRWEASLPDLPAWREAFGLGE